MRPRKTAWTVCALALALGSGCAYAQSLALPQSATDTTTALYDMSQLAGTIFAGEVIRVTRQDGVNGATGVVEVEFAVDDAVLGVNGGTYTLREWAGLWAAGDQPFRMGQRFLMLLHPPGAGGLSSPIGGTDGAIPIRGSSPPQANGQPQPNGLTIDLRWIATRTVRPATYQVAHPTALPVSIEFNGARAEIRPAQESEFAPSAQSANTAISLLPTAGALPSTSTDASYATVIAMLRSWQKDDHAAR